MNIIEAYRYLEKGYLIKRKGWKKWSMLGTKENKCFKVDITDQMLICQEGNKTTYISKEDVLADDWEIKEEKELYIISHTKKKHPTRDRLEKGCIVEGEEFEMMLREEKEEEDREIISRIFDELKTIKQMLSNRVVYIDGEKYCKF